MRDHVQVLEYHRQTRSAEADVHPVPAVQEAAVDSSQHDLIQKPDQPTAGPGSGFCSLPRAVCPRCFRLQASVDILIDFLSAIIRFVFTRILKYG